MLSTVQRPYGRRLPAARHATCGKPLTVFWFATLIGHARSDSKSRVDRLPGSAHGTEATTTPHAAALVMPAAPPSASGASEHTRTWTHPDLEHGFGTRRRIRDPRILCNRAFDVRQSGEWAFAQAFFVIHFFGRKTEYAGTPLTLTKPTARRRTDIHENSNSASFYRGNIFPLYAFIPPYLKALPNIADAATYHVAILCNPLHPLASQRLVRSKPHH